MTKKRKVVIGLLLPSSSIIPLAKDFEKGVMRGLKDLYENDQLEVELVPAFIEQGGKDKTLNAINKLLTYDGADIITGLLSNKSIFEVADRFEKTKIPLLANNLGEHLPDTSKYNVNIFLNSLNLWQQVWSLGYWAVKQFGSKGMFVAGLYDAGYSFSAMLQAGMNAADPEAIMPFAVAPVQGAGQLADVVSVFQHIEHFNPDFIFAAFCGEEASLFLDEYVKRGLHKTKPLIGFPYLLQPFKSDEEIDIYTTIIAGTELKEEGLNQLVELSAYPFPLLGYETGKIIADAFINGNCNDVRDNLCSSDVASERGNLKIDSVLSGENTKVYLVSNKFKGGTEVISRKVKEELVTVRYTDEKIQALLREFSTGWFNPYLGV